LKANDRQSRHKSFEKISTIVAANEDRQYQKSLWVGERIHIKSFQSLSHAEELVRLGKTEGKWSSAFLCFMDFWRLLEKQNRVGEGGRSGEAWAHALVRRGTVSIDDE
jgi:hypothetical protein